LTAGLYQRRPRRDLALTKRRSPGADDGPGLKKTPLSTGGCPNANGVVVEVLPNEKVGVLLPPLALSMGVFPKTNGPLPLVRTGAGAGAGVEVPNEKENGCATELGTTGCEN
jgi:hypothetical protein